VASTGRALRPGESLLCLACRSMQPASRLHLSWRAITPRLPVADPDDTTRSVRHGEALKIEEILCNSAMAVNFAVLSIVKISAAASFEISSYAFVTETWYAEIATVADQTSKRKRDWRSAPLDRMETRR
jgi:hypothetical protein